MTVQLDQLWNFFIWLTQSTANADAYDLNKSATLRAQIPSLAIAINSRQAAVKKSATDLEQAIIAGDATGIQNYFAGTLSVAAGTVRAIGPLYLVH